MNEQPKKPESGFGKASVAVAFASPFFCLFMLYALPLLALASHSDFLFTVLTLGGYALYAVLLAPLIGAVLGIVGLTRKNRSRSYALLGLVSNVGLVLAEAGLLYFLSSLGQGGVD